METRENHGLLVGWLFGASWVGAIVVGNDALVAVAILWGVPLVWIGVFNLIDRWEQRH